MSSGNDSEITARVVQPKAVVMLALPVEVANALEALLRLEKWPSSRHYEDILNSIHKPLCEATGREPLIGGAAWNAD